MSLQRNAVTVLRAPRLLTGVDSPISGNVQVMIRGNRIVDVSEGNFPAPPPGAEVIELDDCTLMPGMIDCHVHTGGFNSLLFDDYRHAMFEITPQLLQMCALFSAQRCLTGGVTTIRDQGWITPTGGHFTRELVAVRDAIERRIVPGPRLLVGGLAACTNSHLEVVIPTASTRLPGVTADGPDEMRKLVRSHLRDRVDHIKTCSSGGGGTPTQHSAVANMSEGELRAVVEEAHNDHRRVACHAWTAESQKRALAAGVDSLEHSVWTDDEAIDMMLSRGVPLVPTLIHRTDRSLDRFEKLGADSSVIENFRNIQKDCFQTFDRLRQRGVKIAMGTDTVMSPEMGENGGELQVYVDLGMTPLEAIQTATVNAADVVGLGDQIGSIEVGKRADIIAVAGDPSVDISLLSGPSKMTLVMKDGDIFIDRVDRRREVGTFSSMPTRFA